MQLKEKAKESKKTVSEYILDVKIPERKDRIALMSDRQDYLKTKVELQQAINDIVNFEKGSLGKEAVLSDLIANLKERRPAMASLRMENPTYTYTSKSDGKEYSAKGMYYKNKGTMNNLVRYILRMRENEERQSELMCWGAFGVTMNGNIEAILNSL